jgi:hypothetical protein
MVASKFSLPKASCPKCGQTARYVGTEPSESDKNIDLHTFECEQHDLFVVEQSRKKEWK